MKVGKPFLRTLVVTGLALGIATAGVTLPAQANPFASPEANAASCSSFKRVKVLSKREILNQVTAGELRNFTGTEDTMVIDRTVSDSRSTSTEYSANWTLFKEALKLGVSRTVTNEHTVTGAQQGRITVAPHRKVLARGMARTWYVKSEVTERNSKCQYKSYRVEGEVATTDDLVWITRDTGKA